MTPERFEHVQDLYARAVELPEPRRAAFLHEACGGDSDLRRDVESLLTQEESACSFMEEPAVKAAAKTLI